MRKHTGSLIAGKGDFRLVVAVSLFLFFTFSENSLENFLAMHLHFGRRVDTNSYLITFHAQHGHRDILTDHQLFPHSSSQYQHGYLPLVLGILNAFSPLSYVNYYTPFKAHKTLLQGQT